MLPGIHAVPGFALSVMVPDGVENYSTRKKVEKGFSPFPPFFITGRFLLVGFKHG